MSTIGMPIQGEGGSEDLPHSLRGRFFRATDRYELRRVLGSGGFGDVYEVRDRERDAIVALKLLREDTPDARYRLKREFRALADIVHPNLVQLYELYTDDAICFITMELVDGVSLVEYVSGTDPASGPLGEAAEARMRAALHQLADGLLHLHEHGRLHLDIKPSNVRVTAAGRVAIVDFGLVDELDLATSTRSVSGTPAYMSPEQMQGHALTPASDWYSVGVAMYQCLAGTLPWSDSTARLFAQKLVAPRPPSDFREGLPEDLVSLCLELLAPDAKARPLGRDIVRRLSTGVSSVTISHVGDVPFVGRGSERTELRLALGSALAGHASAVMLSGPSGIGKSSLVRKFLQDAGARSPRMRVLKGRCYEQESTPFKTVDGVVDSLGRILSGLSEGDVQALTQDGVGELLQLFPALGRVPGLPAPPSAEELGDTLMVRRAAVAELRGILARMAEEGPIVVYVDDLQWGDMEGATLLGDLLRGADAPPVLLIVTHRDGDDRHAPPVVSLESRLRSIPGLYLTTLSVGPLSDEECAALAGSFDGVGSESAEAIAREARGQPYLVAELASMGLSKSSEDIGLEDALQRRVLALDPTARMIVETVAAFGRRVPSDTVRAACGLAGDTARKLRELQAARLVRLSGSGASETVEPYHDYVRVAVQKMGLSRTGQVVHQRLARTLETLEDPDREELAYHWSLAGDLRKASQYLIEAARIALVSYAFGHAAELLARVLSWDVVSPEERQRVRVMCAEALADSGDAAAAAKAFELAAMDAPMPSRIDLLSQAAQQLVSAGDPRRAEEVVRNVLEAVGSPLPRDPEGLATRLLEYSKEWSQLVVGSGLRSRESIPPLDRIRIDTAYEAARHFSGVDPVFAACLVRISYIGAIRADEPSRLAQAIAQQATEIAAVGREDAVGKEGVLLALAESFLDGRPMPTTAANLTIARASGAMLQHRWREAIDHLAWAEEQLRVRARATWALSYVTANAPFVLLQLGEWRRASYMAQAGIEEASVRGDRFLETQLRVSSGWCHDLLTDRPDQSRACLLRALDGWTTNGPGLLECAVGQTLAFLRMYETRAISKEPLAALRQLRSRFDRTGFFTLQTFRVSFGLAVGRALVAAAHAETDHEARASYLQEARGLLMTLRRERNEALQGPIALLDAGVFSLDPTDEMVPSPVPLAKRLVGAITLLEDQGLGDLCAAARIRLATVLASEGRDGRAVHEEGMAFFERQGFVSCDGVIAALAPGHFGEARPTSRADHAGERASGEPTEPR
jgi:eukaryotic-like serine/threonine-protein kinase